MTPFPAGRPGRRAVLGLGVAAVLAGAGPARSAALGPASPAAASGPAGLTAPGRLLLAGVRLRHTTVVQSFAFDETHGHLYALQVVAGGVRLAGEPRALTHAQRARAGDLCLNRLTTDGAPAGAMYLKGFGHGGSIGLDESRGGVRVWTEWDANPASGYGRGVCHFAFADGAVLTRGSRALTTFRPVPGSSSNYAALDTVHRRLLLRYKTGGRPRYRVYDLDAFAAHRYQPVASLPQPGATTGLPYQGMAVHGDHAYQLLGSGFGPGNPASSRGNTRLYRIDLRTGASTWHLETTAPRLNPREPEGLALHRVGKRTRLCMGFTEGAAGHRRFSLYDKPLD